MCPSETFLFFQMSLEFSGLILIITPILAHLNDSKSFRHTDPGQSYSERSKVTCTEYVSTPYPGLQIRLHPGNLFFLFLNQNICCGYSKEPSQ